MSQDLLWKKIVKKFGSHKLPNLEDRKVLSSIQRNVLKKIKPRLELQDSLRAKSLAKSFTKVVC